MYYTKLRAVVIYNFAGSRVKLSVCDNNTERDDLLEKFWLRIDEVIQTSPNQSMLRNMAKLDITLKDELPKDDLRKVLFVAFVVFVYTHNVSSCVEVICSRHF